MDNRGFSLIITIAFLLFSLISGLSFSIMIQNEVESVIKSNNSNLTFYLAEAGIEKGISELLKDSSYKGETGTPLGKGYFDVEVSKLGNNQYQIVSTGYLNNGNSKRIEVIINNGESVSPVFDYSYFINNWGWYWGRNITSNGDVRSNGRFDFVGSPKVEGHIYAGDEIDDHGRKIRGSGGQEDHQHAYSEKLVMPNLQELDYYMELATDRGGQVKIGGALVIDNVFGDDPFESGNIVLVGTPSQPIEIDGPVVVTGDVVIKGVVKGQGTIYAGRNIFIADSLTYKNAPASPRPASQNPDVVDGWVEANKVKDLLGLASQENIIVGDYTKDPYFGYYGWDRWWARYWLFSMGSEDVGMDGIPYTYDEGERDGVFQKEYEDLDGDGVFDDNYNWEDVKTSVDITKFDNLPPGVSSFSDIATLYPHKIECIAYTNHAFAGRIGYGVKFNGSVRSKDKAIVYRNTVTFNYDERIHSKYQDDPNKFIDIGLPVDRTIKTVSWRELKCSESQF